MFKFELTATSEDLPSTSDLPKFITINSLDDLKAIQEKYDDKLVVNFEQKTIEVYNDWRE